MVNVQFYIRRVAVEQGIGKRPADIPLPPAIPPPTFKRRKIVPPPGAGHGISAGDGPGGDDPSSDGGGSGSGGPSREDEYWGGEYTGVAWNAQGFFAARAASHSAKKRYLQKLLARSDFVIFSETHGTVGSQAAFTDVGATTSFWVEGTAARGGVGIIVRNEFLAKIEHHQWERITEGRLAWLTLRGRQGTAHLYAAYFPTGTPQRIRGVLGASAADEEAASLRRQREELRDLLTNHVKSCRGLRIVAGGFNFVMSREDRLNK